MQLTWRGYGISLKVRRKEEEDAPVRAVRLAVLRPPSREQRAEVERQHTLASGNRYVSPMR
jgi:hypothetical protein